jgi:hypothetical protein
MTSPEGSQSACLPVPDSRRPHRRARKLQTSAWNPGLHQQLPVDGGEEDVESLDTRDRAFIGARRAS